MCSSATISNLELECTRRARNRICNSQDMTSASHYPSLPRSHSLLPPEIWLVIFGHATSLHRFFDSRWYNNGILHPFDDANDHSQDIFDAFTKSLVNNIFVASCHVL